MNIQETEDTSGAKTRSWKDAPDFSAAAARLKLLGHPVRLALLAELARHPKCVNDIRDLLDIAQANVSQHLAALRAAGIVACHEQGNVRCYYLLRPELVNDVLRLAHAQYPIVRQTPEQVRTAAYKQGKRAKKGNLS
jgi:ArsR family transcriptional regulator